MLLVRALVGFIFLFLVVAGVLFGLAGTLHDGRAWVTLAVFFGCAGATSLSGSGSATGCWSGE